MSKRKLAD
jgi:hypothetical protein